MNEDTEFRCDERASEAAAREALIAAYKVFSDFDRSAQKDGASELALTRRCLVAIRTADAIIRSARSALPRNSFLRADAPWIVASALWASSIDLVRIEDTDPHCIAAEPFIAFARCMSAVEMQANAIVLLEEEGTLSGASYAGELEAIFSGDDR